MTPTDAVEQLSLNALSAMSNSAFGSIAGPVVDAALVDFLGLGKSDSLAAFAAKIEAALEKIEDQLASPQKSVSSILAGIVVIEERIDDVEVQAALSTFGLQAGIVTEFFATYSNALTALSSSAPACETANAM